MSETIKIYRFEVYDYATRKQEAEIFFSTPEKARKFAAKAAADRMGRHVEPQRQDDAVTLYVTTNKKGHKVAVAVSRILVF